MSKSEKCGALCPSCEKLPESCSPSECICHWCLIRDNQEQFKIFDGALVLIIALGGDAAVIARTARKLARTFKVQDGC